ncbi:MAG: GAF domain-containing protein [Proteobacteria bacterium]|nr:GAF domain-containing protein [Pseudomonadota bacterium]
MGRNLMVDSVPSPDDYPRNPLVTRLKKQLSCLCEMGIVLESTMSLDEILTQMVKQADRVMEAERSTLFLIDCDGNLVSRVIEATEVSEIRLEPGRGIAGWVARSGHPLCVTDVKQDERFDPSWDEKSGFNTRCLLCHPITNHHGKVIGVIEVFNKLEGAVFDESDLELLKLIAGQLALVIENSSLMVDLVEKNIALADAQQDLMRSNRELDLLLDLEQQVTHSEDLDSLTVSILKRVIDITHAELGILYRPDETGAQMQIVVDEMPKHRVIRVEHGTGITGWVATKGQELNLSAPTSDPRFTGHLKTRIGFTPENLAAVPLVSQEDGPPHGALLVANKKIGDGFEETDMTLLRLVASRLSQAIEDLSGRQERERDSRLATIGRLLAAVLHDLRSPISVISGYAELLASRAEGPESEDYLGRVNKALDRITAMTEEIIAFSRGERQILIGTVLLDEVMSDLVEEIRPYLKNNNIDLITHIHLSGAVRLDRGKILRVFHNIVRNAVEAMENGGTLTIEVDKSGQEMVFSFIDTGSGIPENIQGSLFQSFVTSGKGQGTGLGLSVAREIVEAHQGEIVFTTISGKGTTFSISIPYN